MKKRDILLIMLLIIAAVCIDLYIRRTDGADNVTEAPTETPDSTQDSTEAPSPKVVISSSSITVGEGTAVDIYTLFGIVADGECVAVSANMLELGGLNPEQPEEGEYTVRLTYVCRDGEIYSAESTVTVLGASAVTVQIKHTDVTVIEGDIFDTSLMFEITADGERVDITDEMICLGGYESDRPTEGVYTVTLTYTSSDGAAHIDSALLTVLHRVSVTISGTGVTKYEGETVDLTSLFSITADGESIAVRADMIDAGALNTADTTAGDYTVTLTYISFDGASHTGTATVHIIRRWIGPF